MILLDLKMKEAHLALELAGFLFRYHCRIDFGAWELT